MKYRIKPFEMNNGECENIIKGTFHGVLSLSDETEPYAVPMNHAYEDGTFCFHCALGGKKIDCTKRSPSVVYTIMKYYGSPEDYKSRHDCYGKWESIIAYGTARYVEERDELRDLFTRFMRYYGKHDFKPTEVSLLETRAIVMQVRKMTARRELETKATEFYEWRNPNHLD